MRRDCHERTLGRTPPPADRGRHQGPAGGGRPAQGVRRDAHLPAPAVRRATGHRQDDRRPRPDQGCVRRGLQDEPPGDERQRRAQTGVNPHQGQAVRQDRAIAGHHVQGHLPRRGRRPHSRCPRSAAQDHGAKFADVQVHPLVQLLLQGHRAHPVPLRGVPVPPHSRGPGPRDDQLGGRRRGHQPRRRGRRGDRPRQPATCARRSPRCRSRPRSIPT